jgi:hypothetical protein
LTLLCAALLANNLSVLDSVYREVEWGLSRDVRDAWGAPKR